MSDFIICMKCHKKERVQLGIESSKITIQNLYELDELEFELCDEHSEEFMTFVKKFINLKED